MNVATLMEFVESMIKSATVSNTDGAYGSGMAGQAFDPLGFIKKPQVILRIVSILFAVIVFGCIASEDLYGEGKCPLDEDGHACGFGITIGVIAFLVCVVFLLIDARFDSFSNVKTRKRAVIVDMAFSGIWSLVWFITFCYLANSWRNTSDEISSKAEAHKIRTAIAFSFFSIITWAMICLLNFLRYRQGVSTTFSSSYDEQNLESNDPNSADQYRQAPFSNNINNGSNSGGYQQPNF